MVALLVEFLDEIDRGQILASAVLIGNPIARLAAVVEIEHRGHRVDAQSVDVVFVEPEERIGGEEVAHFVAAVIEDQGPPVGVLALSRIGMLVKMRAVEHPQAVAVAREVGRHPVEHHADAVLVAMVDKVHEVLRRAVAAGGGIVADRSDNPSFGCRGAR